MEIQVEVIRPMVEIEKAFVYLYFQWIGENSIWEYIPIRNKSEEAIINFINDDKSSGVLYSFQFKRKSFYFALNLFGPVILLTVLQFSTFLIPPNSIERVSYSATVMLAMFVLHDQILSYLPVSPNQISVSLYLMAVMGFGTFTTFYSALIGSLIPQSKYLNKRISIFKIKLFTLIDCSVFTLLFIFIATANALIWRMANKS